jgi:putative ATP-binding cassette transporter
MRSIINLSRMVWQASPLVFVLSLFSGLVSGLTSAVLVALIHEIVRQPAGQVRVPLGYVALCVGLFASKMISAGLILTVSQRALQELRLRLCRRIQEAPLRELERLGTARIQTVLAEDMSTFGTALLAIPGTAIQLSILIGCLFYLAWLSGAALGVFVLLMVVGIGLTWQAQRVAVKHYRRSREVQDHLFQHYRALTEGIKELKLSGGRAERYFTSLGRATDESRTSTTSAFVWSSMAYTMAEMLFFVVIALLVLLVPRISPFAPDTRSGFTLATLYLLTPLMFLLRSLSEYIRSEAALRMVRSLGIDLSAEEGAAAAVESPTQAWGTLELRGVLHRYTDDKDRSFTLGPIDLQLRQGELVFIVGGNGGGKTTLAKTLCGLYPPQAGSIELAGRAVGAEQRAWYRGHFSAVFSDFFLFDDMVGGGGLSVDADAERYLRELELDEVVTVRDGRLSTTALSQGQRKRVALLQVMLDRAPICLFDEWAADQDPRYRKVFYTEILPALRRAGRTIVAITHDDRYFGLADRVLRLDDGKLAEIVVEDAARSSGRS